MTHYILRIAPVAPVMQKQPPSVRRTARIKVPEETARAPSLGSGPLQGWTASSPASPEQRHSETIPLPSSHVHRTQSELQLSEDLEQYERRDLSMFCRLVNGIRDRQMHMAHDGIGSPYAHTSVVETNSCIANIINTRNTPLDAAPIQTLDRFRAMDDARMAPTNLCYRGGGEGVPGCADEWSISGFEQPPQQMIYTRNYSSCQSSMPGPDVYSSPYRQSFDPEAENHNNMSSAEDEEEIFNLDM